MKHDVALKAAEALVKHLRPACVRIEIAGSIRREKPEVKDIEILAVPDLTPVARVKPEFGKPIPPVHKTLLDKLVTEMENEGDIRLEANGDRLKKLYLNYAGIKVDLFISIPPSEWGVQMVIRTGPSDFSHWCVTRRNNGGALLNSYFVKHQVVWIENEITKHEVPEDPNKSVAVLSEQNHLSMPEESDFLKFLDLEWIEPRERVARWTR
jgi:DNA polymerase/3'-5' exonuclease PolX